LEVTIKGRMVDNILIDMVANGMRLAREPGAGSREKRAGSRDCRKKSRNREISPKIEFYSDVSIKKF
jgi:hypothetical protein